MPRPKRSTTVAPINTPDVPVGVVTVPATRGTRRRSAMSSVPLARSTPVDVARLRQNTPTLKQLRDATGVPTAPGQGKQPTAKQLQDARGVARGEVVRRAPQAKGRARKSVRKSKKPRT